MSETASTTFEFQAEVSQVLSLVINSLYSNKEIFMRELVSNASDALDKLRFEGITRPELIGDDAELRVRLIPDEEANTLTIADNGIGMTRDELINNLGTVARSGSRDFIARLQEAAEQSNGGDVQLIGQFGVGFYSAFLVADRVEVVSRAAGGDDAWRWSSAGSQTFELTEAERDERGTDIVLHLKEEQADLLKSWRLRELVTRYSDYLSHPIELRTVNPDDDTVSFEKVNQSTAVWRRDKDSITDDQYEEFYKHLTHDWDAPLAHVHFKIEGTQVFTGLLFVPKRPPFDLFDANQQRGVRLYVKRVFIMDDCEELLPKWLRFMRGVIDSDDLPLNVSRELLQDSRITRTIRKQVIKKSLGLLEELAEDKPEDYADFWSKYGAVLKEGVHFEAKHRERIAGLLRYSSSTQEDDLTSLDDYISRMAEDQKAIYYITGASKKVVANSPHLEALRSRGYEILYMTDSIDQWVVDSLQTYNDKPLVSAMKADLDLDDDADEDAKKAKEEQAESFKPLTGHIQAVLDDRVKEVRLSERLTDSPVCLVIPDGGLPSHIERLLRANQQNLPTTKRILELNPSHPLINRLRLIQNESHGEKKIEPWIELLYDQALLAEGSPIDDPARFASRMTDLMQTAISGDATA